MSAHITDHVATGQTDGIRATKAVYYVDFTTGSGSGSAKLEMLVGSTWIPADAAVTDTMAKALMFDLNPTTSGGRFIRWNVTRASGTITTYIDILEGSRNPG